MVLLVDEHLGLSPATVSSVLALDAAACVYVIWLGQDRRNVPSGCGLLVRCGPAGQLEVTDVPAGTTFPTVAGEGLGSREVADFARGLAGLRDDTIIRRSAEVPRRVSLLELLGRPGPEDLVDRWASWDHRLRGPIGASDRGPVTIDLRSDGPHGLIAGTTGSGKSELLRSIVASLCVSCPPTRLTFLLIDYKGGAAFAPCAAFPHVLEVVSDLDEQMADRALVSLRAELRRRERILAEHGADSVRDLERRNPEAAPPSLVIMVDEFAKLREEVPDFVDGVVDIAQRGRTLGVHMVLAAQTLHNAFTAAIRANTNLRIALRVADDNESMEVISARDAAKIPSGAAHKGRAFLATGHRELTELQVAYVSGLASARSGGLTLEPFGFAGSDRAAPLARRGADREGTTDLALLAGAVQAAARRLSLDPSAGPWLAPLGLAVPADAVALDTNPRNGEIAVGVIDDPANQRQPPLVLDLERHGHVIVYGAGGSGKSTLLRTVAASLATVASPAVAQLYAIDAAGHGLAALAELPHCGAVIDGNDEERVGRLLEMLVTEVDERLTRFGPAGAATLSQYRSTGQDAPPRIVLLLDGLTDFHQRNDLGRAGSPVDLLAQLLARGRGAGVHVVMTADRRAAGGSALTSTVGARIALRMASPEDLTGFGVDLRVARAATMPPGRGFTSEGLALQLVLPPGVRRPETQAEDLAALGARLQARWADQRAPGVRALPDRLARAELPTGTGWADLPVGLGGRRVGVCSIDLSSRHFLVAGGYRSGRSTALGTIATAIRLAVPDAELRLIAPRPTPLTAVAGWDDCAAGLDGCMAAVAELEELVATRAATGTHPPLVVIVDDAGELGDGGAFGRLERLVRAARDVGVRLVVAAETSTARNVTVSWLREIRKDAHGLLLCPELPNDGDILGAQLPRRSPAPLVPGRGYLVAPGAAELVHIAQ